MGTTSEKLTYLNTTKALIKEELNLGGANITTEPFRQYKSKLEGIYKDFLANGTDTLWNNWEKVTGSGTEISLNNTIEAKMDFVYKGNTSQNGTPTPDNPINIDVVTGNNSITIANNDNTQSQTYPINIGNIELCKIGDYQDKIYKDNGKWYLNKKTGKIVYNGSESGRWTPSVNGGFTRFAGPYISNAQQTVSRLQIKSNYFHYLSSGNEIGGGFIYAGQFFAYPNQTITTEQNFRDWLSTHNTTVYYVLATPTTTEITDTELIYQLEATKKSYNNQTNISQENSKEAFILDVTALGN